MDVSLHAVLLLAAVAGLAGFIDAIAGGGGLLTLPALMMAGFPAHQALGTNKGQSVFGSGAALLRFLRSPLLDRGRAKISFLPALGGAAAGAALVSQLHPDVLRPVVMALLLSAAFLLMLPGPRFESKRHVDRPAWHAAGTALVLGTYDGFFGPGTGTFLIIAYALWWKDRLDEASANAKVANFASNLAALLAFAWQGAVMWKVALPMALGQAVGSHFGAHVTIRKGARLVRLVVILVSMALVARMGWQMFQQQDG